MNSVLDDQSPASVPEAPAPDQRPRWMGVLARADRATLEAVWRDLPDAPGFRHLRPPEIGLAMVCGRMGGDGQRFNLGETTIPRPALAPSPRPTPLAHAPTPH